MHPTALIKRAPKWAWYGAAGLTAGAIGIKVWKGRAADPATEGEAGDGTTAGDGMQTSSPSGGGPTSVIVPPVIAGSDGGDPNAGLSPLWDVASGVIGQWGQIVGTVLGDEHDLVMSQPDTVSGIWQTAISTAGSAPAPAASNPTVVVTVPANPQPAAAPVPSAQDWANLGRLINTQQAKPALAPRHSPNDTPAYAKDAPAGFPYHSARGWYRLGTSKGMHAHIYKDGTIVRVKD